MPRPTRKKIEFNDDSLRDMLQNIWSEADEQRQKAVFTYNKQNKGVKDNTDIALIGKTNTELLKIVNDAIEKKLSVAKLVKDINYAKATTGTGNDTGNQVIPEDYKEFLFDKMQENLQKNNMELVLDKEKKGLDEIAQTTPEDKSEEDPF